MQIKAYYSTRTSIDVCKLLDFTDYLCVFKMSLTTSKGDIACY